MDVLQIIKADHDRVRSLLTQVENSTDQAGSEAFESLSEELKRHTKIEESYLYPEIASLAAEKYPGFFDFCIANHRTIVRTLTAMKKAASGADGELFSKHLQSLKKVVLAHFAAEEDNLMPLVRKYVPTAEREELGFVFQDLGTSSDLLEDDRGSGVRKKNRA